MAEFTRSSQRRIANVVTSYEKQHLSARDRNKKNIEVNRASVLVKTPANGIPARSGTTLGKATCTVQDIDKSNDTIADGTTVDVYNVSDKAIGGSIYVRAVRDRKGAYVAENASISGGGTSFAHVSYQLIFNQAQPGLGGWRYPFIAQANAIIENNDSPGDFFLNGSNLQISCQAHITHDLRFKWSTDAFDFYNFDRIGTALNIGMLVFSYPYNYSVRSNLIAGDPGILIPDQTTAGRTFLYGGDGASGDWTIGSGFTFHEAKSWSQYSQREGIPAPWLHVVRADPEAGFGFPGSGFFPQSEFQIKPDIEYTITAIKIGD